MPARPLTPPPMLSTAARRLALNVLMDVHLQEAYASLALDDRLRAVPKMDPRDRRLATELVYGTLEKQIRLDYMLDTLLERKDLEPVVRDILRMGAYQITFLDRVPDSAAVDESVKLARLMDRESFTGLVNAVLRNLIRTKNEISYPSAQTEPARHISVLHSVPLWLVERLNEAYGPAMALAICRHVQQQHAVTVRPNLARITPAAFEALLSKEHLTFAQGIVPGAYRIEGGGELTRLTAYEKGLFSIQGESAMLAAQAVGVKPGWNVLDACAAPGGKSALMAEAMEGTGRVQAWDVHEHRVNLLKAMAQRLKLDNVRPALRDAQALREDMVGTMDAVLIDAPCSGLGVMLEKPDIKYRMNPEKVTSLVAVQKNLLDACCQYVKPGGVLVYATCTILPEENSGQIQAFLESHPDFEPEGLGERLPESLRGQVEGAGIQLFAHRDGIEGFYIARLRRRKP